MAKKRLTAAERQQKERQQAYDRDVGAKGQTGTGPSRSRACRVQHLRDMDRILNNALDLFLCQRTLYDAIIEHINLGELDKALAIATERRDYFREFEDAASRDLAEWHESLTEKELSEITSYRQSDGI